jgi:hypothetical protein
MLLHGGELLLHIGSAVASTAQTPAKFSPHKPSICSTATESFVMTFGVAGRSAAKRASEPSAPTASVYATLSELAPMMPLPPEQWSPRRFAGAAAVRLALLPCRKGPGFATPRCPTFNSATDTPQYCKGLFTILNRCSSLRELLRKTENDLLSDPGAFGYQRATPFLKSATPVCGMSGIAI